MSDGTTTARDLTMRSHSWRNYEPEEFIEAAKADGKVNAREELRTVEGGRFYPLLEAGHKFFTPLDPDERREWAKRNPDMMEWIAVWGYLEDLNYFPDYSGIDP